MTIVWMISQKTITMKRTRFKWILFYILVTFSGLTYCLDCEPLPNLFEFSSNYLLRRQDSELLSSVRRLQNDVPESNISSACCAFLDDFASGASDFIKCSVDYTKPFRVCGKCVTSYERVTSVFNDIEKNVGNCHVFLLDSDRIQSILQINTMIKKLWDDSYCENCFVKGSIKEDANGTVTYEFNSDTIDFLNQYKNLTECIEPYINGTYPEAQFINYTVCDACLNNYYVLNRHFTDMREDYEGKICMDLVDMMNYTRLKWGGERDLNCTRHERDDMPVLLTSFILLTIPLLFYGAGCICGERRKLKIMTQKRLTNPLSVEVSCLNRSSDSNHVNYVSHVNNVS